MFNRYKDQPTMNHKEPKSRSPPVCNARPCAISSELLASFNNLPTTVQKMMEQRGVLTPTELRTSAVFTRSLEQNLDPVALRTVTDQPRDLRRGLNVVRGHLRSRSAEGLAIHLYTNVLPRLIGIAAARQHLEAVRSR